MGRPSKFTAETRKIILETLSVGASRRTAAALAHVDEATLRRWLEQGKTASEGSRWQEFREAVLAAEAHPGIRALGVIYKEIPDNPNLAWKFVERKMEGFAPPQPASPGAPQGPVVIQLSLHDGSMPALGQGEVIEGEVVDEQDDGPSPAPSATA